MIRLDGAPLSRHDTEEEAEDRAAAYRRGLERERLLALGARGEPRQREVDVTLRDGTPVHIRPVRTADRPLICLFLEHLSPDAIAYRFFGTPSFEWVTAWTCEVTDTERFALIAEKSDPAEIVAHAAYVRAGADRAEVAFLVTDPWQGRGLATILLELLAETASAEGITTFTADVLPYNHRMVDVFRDSGFAVRVHATRDALEIELPTSHRTGIGEKYGDGPVPAPLSGPPAPA